MANIQGIRMRTNTAVTVYNKYISSGVEAYQRANIDRAEWENTKATNVLSTGGTIAADQATIYIPMAIGDNYLPPRAWQALTNKSGFWTLQPGDVIIKGTITDAIEAQILAAMDDEFDTVTLTMLKTSFDDCLLITSVDMFDMGSMNLRHFRIGAK